MRAACPLSGQYGPLWPWGVCRECSLAEPYPIEVFQVDPQSKDRSGLRIDPEASSDQLNRRIMLENLVRDSVKGAPIGEAYKFNITLRQLRNPIRYSRAHQYAAWHREAAILARYEQLDLPYCHRCNKVGVPRNAMGYCPHCVAEIGAESLWNNRAIFGADDLEGQLDKLYRSFPEWFECGVLPDYWFELAQKAE